MRLSDISLVMTCESCPEQYDVFYKDKLVGYIRLRHGYLSVRCPDLNGELVYDDNPKGQGSFYNEAEKRKYLKNCKIVIANWIITKGKKDVKRA